MACPKTGHFLSRECWNANICLIVSRINRFSFLTNLTYDKTKSGQKRCFWSTAQDSKARTMHIVHLKFKCSMPNHAIGHLRNECLRTVNEFSKLID